MNTYQRLLQTVGNLCLFLELCLYNKQNYQLISKFDIQKLLDQLVRFIETFINKQNKKITHKLLNQSKTTVGICDVLRCIQQLLRSEESV